MSATAWLLIHLVCYGKAGCSMEAKAYPTAEECRAVMEQLIKDGRSEFRLICFPIAGEPIIIRK